MARRKLLKSIASGMLGSFVSRNNDISGYWGIGVLCLHAGKMQTDAFVLDLLNQKASPLNEQALVSTEQYSAMLIAALEGQKISSSWVKSALLTVNFNPAYVEKFHRRGSSLGGRYICSLELVDDLDRKHCVRYGGVCWPHDAKRESRSTRVNDF